MAIGFKLVVDPDTTIYKQKKIASQAYTIGDGVMEYNTGSATKEVDPATSATTTYGMYAVAMETVTSAATSMLVCLITPRQEWSVEVVNTALAAHNGQKMVLYDKSTVNNTGTTSAAAQAVFEQMGILSTTRIVGKFLKAANVTA